MSNCGRVDLLCRHWSLERCGIGACKALASWWLFSEGPMSDMILVYKLYQKLSHGDNYCAYAISICHVSSFQVFWRQCPATAALQSGSYMDSVLLAATVLPAGSSAANSLACMHWLLASQRASPHQSQCPVVTGFLRALPQSPSSWAIPLGSCTVQMYDLLSFVWLISDHNL